MDGENQRLDDKNEPVIESQLSIGRKGVTIQFRDILAAGVVLLALGAVVVAIIVATGLYQGRITAADAKSIILGCVGGSAIASVVAALITGRKNSASSQNAKRR